MYGLGSAYTMQAMKLAFVLALVITWVVLFRPPVLGGGAASFVFIQGDSMEPSMSWGDLAVVRGGSYEVGDVVAFRVPEENRDEGNYVIHRIIGGEPSKGFTTQGDHSEEPDVWRPRPDDIVGKLWFNIPGGANWLAFATQPMALVAICGIVVLVSLEDQPSKRRRRGGRRVQVPHSTTGGGGTRLSTETRWLAGAAVLLLAAIALAAAAMYSFMQPTTKDVFEQRVRLEHSVAFDYTVATSESELYPGGVIGPIEPGGAVPLNQTPIYAKLAKTMDLGINYSVAGVEGADVNGELSATLQIQAEEGWTRSEELLPPTPFSGTRSTARVQLDLTAINALIERLQLESGFNASSYTASVNPTVKLSGTVDSEPLQETYTTSYPIVMDATWITPDTELLRHDVKSVGETVNKTNRVAVIGVPVVAMRWAGALLALCAFAGAAALAVRAFRRLAKDETVMIRARYGSMLVSVADVEQRTARRVRVASIQDLVRVAQRDGRAILHENGTSLHRYFVDDGTVSYEYEVLAAAESREDEGGAGA